MKKITVTDVRGILEEVIGNYDDLYEMAMRTPNDKLLKMDLRADFGLDSLDVEEMCDKVYNLYGVAVDIYGHHPLAHYSFESEPTVENFIETVNYCLSLET